MMALPYLPPSSAKKSFKSCVAQTAAPPSPRIILKISSTKSAAIALEDAPIRHHNSSSMMTFFRARDSLHLSQQESSARNIPSGRRSLPISEISSTMYLFSKSTFVACPSLLAEPVTNLESESARLFTSGRPESRAYKSFSVGISRKSPFPSKRLALS